MEPMGKIKVIPEDYPGADKLVKIIENIILLHPLLDSNNTSISDCLHDKPIYVEISNYQIGIDLSIRLLFDPMMYQDQSIRNKVFYHEFTHIIDRLNPKFGIDCKKEEAAKNAQPKKMTNNGFMLYMSIWNIYIDGRLFKHNQNPKSLEERLSSFHKSTEKFDGYFTKDADEVLKCAWNSTNLTFSDIIGLVQKLGQYWKPNNIKETK
jgi:hypothetical protein